MNGIEDVRTKLESSGAKVNLFKGDTNITLGKQHKKLPKMDFIFIDGGHSIKTIENDWKHSRMMMHEKTVVVFDDYFKNNEPEVRGVGCQTLINSLDKNKYDVEFLEPEDHFEKGWGTLNIRMVKVTPK